MTYSQNTPPKTQAWSSRLALHNGHAVSALGGAREDIAKAKHDNVTSAPRDGASDNRRAVDPSIEAPTALGDASLLPASLRHFLNDNVTRPDSRLEDRWH